jgi:hypothetical protein
MVNAAHWPKLALALSGALVGILLAATTALADTPTPTVTAIDTAPFTATATATTTPMPETPTVTPTMGTVTVTPTPPVATVTPTATSSVPHDSRYFSQTGYRIDNDTIWDYFNRRGSVTTFGYPVSRTFLLQGFTVQFFQRRIVQLDSAGHARLLNVLDPGLMPYSSFNGATLPGIDSGLVASAPNPADSVATLDFVKAHAPDSFQGMAVNYYQTFLNTVQASVAFPNGGDPGLLPGFDLEMWGVPTSGVLVDPNNHNFVYLRFQRGIMHFDLGCNCTQGILLVDYFKSIFTGQNLPADVDQEAQGSIFYKQYDSTQPQWVHNPSLLPATDLTNAFTAE